MQHFCIVSIYHKVIKLLKWHSVLKWHCAKINPHTKVTPLLKWRPAKVTLDAKATHCPKVTPLQKWSPVLKYTRQKWHTVLNRRVVLKCCCAILGILTIPTGDQIHQIPLAHSSHSIFFSFLWLFLYIWILFFIHCLFIFYIVLNPNPYPWSVVSGSWIWPTGWEMIAGWKWGFPLFWHPPFFDS